MQPLFLVIIGSVFVTTEIVFALIIILFQRASTKHIMELEVLLKARTVTEARSYNQKIETPSPDALEPEPERTLQEVMSGKTPEEITASFDSDHPTSI